ncbi:hypothetical protein [Pontimicrobium sp. SW4]|uniref:Uncharacterized protein n=1 Tax=Pontimicrobium sp. SW4 TaxID=3153519 RepID=A0AAU7BU46_9FLAO
MKVASLHVIVHNDDGAIEHCEVCQLVTASNLTPTISDSFKSDTFCDLDFNVAKIVIDYNFIYSSTPSTTNLFSRPPPVLI